MKTKTRRRKQILRLRRSYNELIHRHGDGVFFKDVRGRYQIINRVAANIFGYKVRNFINKRSSQVFSFGAVRRLEALDKRVLRTKKTEKFEGKIVVSRREVFFEITEYPIFDHDGHVIFLCGIVRDITRVKKDEEALAERIKELSALYQVSQEINRRANLNDLFQDVANISCTAMDLPHPYFIVWLYDETNTKCIKTFQGLKNAEQSVRQLKRKGSFAVPLKIDSEIIGGIAAGYCGRTSRLPKEERDFLVEIAALVAKEIERRKIKEDLQRMFVEMVKSFSSALDARDSYTVDHSKRMANSSRLIAERLHLSGKDIETIVLCALLHDIGKIGISDKILSKPSRLTPEEFDRVKCHPLISERILKPIAALKSTLRVIRHHHERYDGKGYPDGLKGRSIPLGARILAACDAYDAMISERPYRSALSVNKALEEMKKNSGTQFDPKIAAIIIDLVEQNLFY